MERRIVAIVGSPECLGNNLGFFTVVCRGAGQKFTLQRGFWLSAGGGGVNFLVSGRTHPSTSTCAATPATTAGRCSRRRRAPKS